MALLTFMPDLRAVISLTKISLFALAKNSNKVFPFVLNSEKMGRQNVDLLYGSAHYYRIGETNMLIWRCAVSL